VSGARVLLAAAMLAAAVPACGGDDDGGAASPSGDRGQAARDGSRPASPEESIRGYGSAADEATRTEIATAVEAFYAAKAAGDGPKACALLARAARRPLIETLARSSPRLKGEGCGSILSLLFERQPGDPAKIGRVEVTGARVRDDRGIALIDIEATPEEVIPVRRENGSWKVAAVAGSEIP
jgi:hypothetical protein